MTKLFESQQFLAIYSGVVTLILAVTLLGGLSESLPKQKFSEIDVERINVVEPDGTLRMVISNKANFPGIIIKGKEDPHPTRKTAGMLFFNDEGTENGGLIFGGSKDKQGKVSSYGHLSFDRYEQDQVFTVEADEEGRAIAAQSCAFRCATTYPITEDLADANRIAKVPKDNAEVWRKFRATTPHSEPRVYLGRSPDRSVALRLKDVQGHDRIVISVRPDGTPILQFLDGQGGDLAMAAEQGARGS